MLNIVHLVSNKSWGGGERYALDLCRRAAADGHSVAVVTRRCPQVDSMFAEAGFAPGHLPLRGVLDFVSPTMLARVLDRIDAPIVVHTHNFKTAGTAVRARRLMRNPGKERIVTTRHLVKKAKTTASARQLYSDIDAIIFVSEAARREFLSSSPAIDSSSLYVVLNAVSDRPAAEPVEKAEGEIRLAYCGRLDPEKGLEVLIDALAKVQNPAITLHIAGAGKSSYVQQLVRRCQVAGIADRVVWHGHLDNVAPLMASADIGVAPSVCPEACSLTIIEFLRQGVPVIASNTGANPELVENGATGLLVPAGDSDALAGAISRLASDHALRRTMAEAARKEASARFTYDNFYRQISAIYSPPAK